MTLRSNSGSPRGGGARPHAPRPPRLWQRLLEAAVFEPYAELVLGDLHESFARVVERRGIGAARRWYRREAARLIVRMLLERVREATAPAPRGDQPVGAALVRDLGYAVRQIVHARRTHLAIALIVAVGVGTSNLMASVLHRVLLDPLGFERPDRLVLLWGRADARPGRFPLAGPEVAAAREQVGTLESVAFVARSLDRALSGDAVVHVRLGQATHNLLDVLGVTPALGRGFVAADALDTAAAPPVSARPAGSAAAGAPDVAATPVSILLSHALWTSTTNRDPAVIGRSLRIDGAEAVVVGVLPEGFALPLPPDSGIATDIDVWVPIGAELAALRRDEGRLIDQDSDNSGAAIARLRDGATLAQLRQQLDATASARRAEDLALETAGFGMLAEPMRDDVAAHARPALVAVALGVAFLLAICCVNASILVLARGVGRLDEMRIRTSLGASRGALLRLLALESLLSAGLGAALGVVAATWLLPWCRGLLPADFPGVAALRLEPSIVALTTLASVGLVVAASLAPALRLARAGADARPGAGGSNRTTDSGVRVAMQSGLVVAQVALAVVMLGCSGLLARTVVSLGRVDPGFDASRVLTFQLSLSGSERYRGPAARARFSQELSRALARVTGVEAVGLVGSLPLTGRRWSQPYGEPGDSWQQWQNQRADFRMISSGYFEAMGIGLLAGRTFSETEDVEERERIVVVDELLAGRLDPAGNVLGRRIGIPLDGDPVDARIVGVVEHVRHEDLRRDAAPTIYVPYRQEASRELAFAIRTRAEPTALVPAVRDVIRGLDPELPPYVFESMRAHVDRSMAQTRTSMILLAVFAAAALLSSAIGLHGVVAASVARRTPEFGVRMALGADTRSVLVGVLRAGLRSSLVGVAVGVAAGLAVSRLLVGMLHGVGPADPATWLGLVMLVLVTTLVACWVPARRAAALQPSAALRREG